MINRAELEERLDILHSAEMISSTTHATSNKVLDLMVMSVGELDQEKMEIFVTHFAMALNRIENGDDDFEASAGIGESLKNEPMYEQGQALLDEIKQLAQIELPLGEQNLLLIHICNILG